MDLLLNTNPLSPSYGDLTYRNGPLSRDLTTQARIEVVAQRLLIRLSTWREEWFLDQSYGVPYWNILGSKTSKSAVDLIFQQQILLEEGVREITSFQSTLSNREYRMTFRVRVNTGEITPDITITPII